MSRDAYLEGVRAKLGAEIAELRAKREALDHLNPSRERELADVHLGFQRYDHG